MDMFISHLKVPPNGSELPPDKLKSMDQALHGITALLYSSHNVSTSEDICSCWRILAINWSRMLDYAEFILNSAFSGSYLTNEHLEKQVSAVFHAATRIYNLVKQMYDAFGEKTVDVVSTLLLRQDKRTGWPWSNEETVVSLYRYKFDDGILTTFVKATGDDSYQITETLTERYRLVSKEGITMQSITRMEPLLFLIAAVINEYSFKSCAKHNMKKITIVAKSLSAIADTLNSPENREDKDFRSEAAQTILSGLMMYNSICGYSSLPLAIQVVRLGLFDVVLAVNPVLVEMKEKEFNVGLIKDIMNTLFRRVLPELLIYGSFVNVVVSALRPLSSDVRFRILWKGVFGDAWSRFDRILLERYTLKRFHHTEAKRSNTMMCQNVSINGFDELSLLLLTPTEDDCKTNDLKRNFKKCSVCMLTRYCSAECQKAHWKTHRPTCERPNLEDATMIQRTPVLSCWKRYI